MEFIADLHIHSHFSIATSKKLNPEHLDYWAKMKGIRVMGTGDFTHPGWIEELKEKIEPAEPGLFKLKKEFKLDCPVQETEQNSVRFILSAEISNIYKKMDKVRKVHNIVLAPDFETADRIQQKLQSLNFNITSDGRPILGYDSRNLLELCLEANENIFFIPAHIWTPWFSVLGSKSGFNTIEECFDDLSSHIYAVETGLSTDPPMNWMCSMLDKYTLMSNSDAHSPEKLGRNANLFNTELDYNSITRSLKREIPDGFVGTFDMFPQEGKYHFDGHRKCSVGWSPLDTLRHNGICPVCGKKVTIGVTNRVAELSDRSDISERQSKQSFNYIIPLKEILAEIHGVSESSKKISSIYQNLVSEAGSEFNILHYLGKDDIIRIGGDVLGEAIQRMRNHRVLIQEGYDGEYGRIHVFRKDEQNLYNQQEALFEANQLEEIPIRPLINFDLNQYRSLYQLNQGSSIIEENEPEYSLEIKEPYLKGLNKEQYNAAQHTDGPAIIMAGPGTGKTNVLIRRLIYLVNEKQVNPEHILAVTFTNKAAEELTNRYKELHKEDLQNKPLFATFHVFGYRLLKDYSQYLGRSENFTIVDDNDKNEILKKLGIDSKNDRSRYIKEFVNIKQNLLANNQIQDETVLPIFQKYESFLEEFDLFDLEDMIYQSVQLMNKNPDILTKQRQQFRWIMIDEFQDINYNQYQLIKQLCPESSSNLFAIGDPNQAIYGFRGSSTKFISQFIGDFPEVKIHKLNRSYRCSDTILQASSNVLKEDEFLKGLEEGLKIKISAHQTDKSEAEYIAREIERLAGGLRFFSMDSQITNGENNGEIQSLSDFAILCRTKSQMASIEKALNDHTIPYQTVSDDNFFQQQTIKDIINLLKHIFQPENAFIKLKISNLDTLAIQDLIEKIKNKKISINELINHISDNYFTNEKEESPLLFTRLNEIAQQSDSIHDFFKIMALGQDQDTYEYNIERVSVLTLHASKGLEFKCVFIAGCENELIPYTLYHKDNNIEEERRLLYVGMTRAKSQLYLTHAKKRVIRGRELTLSRSPFLNSIEKQLFEIEKEKLNKKKDDSQLSLF